MKYEKKIALFSAQRKVSSSKPLTYEYLRYCKDDRMNLLS